MQWEKYFRILDRAEQLKNNTRHSWTSAGRRESVAEHCWRLTIMAYFLKDKFENTDMNRVILMCMFHDIGEAFTGDIPAFKKTERDREREERVVCQWLEELDEPYKTELHALFDEMKECRSEEAKLYRALDKMEAVIQHNEADIRTWLPLEYELQLTYGKKETEVSEVTMQLREFANSITLDKIKNAETAGYVKEPVKDVSPYALYARTENEAVKSCAAAKADVGSTVVPSASVKTNEPAAYSSQMGVIRLVLGACFTNCYLAYSQTTQSCMIIDPADSASEIVRRIEEKGLKPRYIAITHGHTDHVLAAAELAEKYKIPVIVSKIDAWRLLDEELINDRPYVEKPYKPVRPSFLLGEGDEIWLDDIKFSVMILPGHTPGSMALIAENVIFTGDTMLAGGHGKTSLYGGNEADMEKSIRRLKELPGNYFIYPGHKEITTLDTERGRQ